MWTELRNRIRYLVGGRRIDRDLAQELEFHRDMLTADQERLGYSHETALLNARRKMGNTTLMTEYSRDAWMVSWLDALNRDVRYALRSFARNPGFALVAIATLALGIGANTAIFRLVDAVMLRALPVQHPEQLLAIRGSFSYWRFEQLRDRNEVLSCHTRLPGARRRSACGWRSARGDRTSHQWYLATSSDWLQSAPSSAQSSP
jgi:putative ABC transport system permease protein